MKTRERRGTGSIKYDFLLQKFGVDDKDIIPMWVADMDFVIAEPIQRAIIDCVQDGILGYTAINTSEDIQLWQKKKGFEIKKSWVAGLPNVVVGIDLAIRCFTEIGDKIIVPSPVYGPFFNLVEENHRKIVDAPLKVIEGKSYFDYETFDPEAKMILLCHPHNPLGRVWSKEELIELGDYCLKNDMIIVSDEIHSDFMFEGSVHYPIASLKKEFLDRTITLNSCSKTFNLAGLTGTAYAIIASPEMNKRYKAEIERMKLYPNMLGQLALNTAYTQCDQWLSELLGTIQRNRELVISFFNNNDLGIKAVRGHATYLLWLDFRDMKIDPSEIEKRLLKEAKVALNRGNEFRGEGFFRMNLATNTKNVEEALQRIKRTFSCH